MRRLEEYSLIAEREEGVESLPGCEACKEHRELVEQVYQLVSSNFYSPVEGAFTQDQWWGAEVQRGTNSIPRGLKEEAPPRGFLQQKFNPTYNERETQTFPT